MIPEELQSSSQWCVWKYETVNARQTKVPYCVATGMKASTINPKHWCDYKAASLYVEAGYADGVGFVFTKDDSYIGIDFDHCIVDNVIDPIILNEVISIGSYAEISPSGTGIHVICRGILPRTDRCRGNNREVYDRGRFFTMTGNHIPDTPSGVWRYNGGSLEHIFEMMAPKFTPFFQGNPKDCAFKHIPEKKFSNRATRDVYMECCGSPNKYKFGQLMRGEINDYPSHSEADLALCNLIAEHTDNAIIIDYLFRQSKLYREKWDKVRNGMSYGSATINMAIHGKFMNSLRNILEDNDGD